MFDIRNVLLSLSGADRDLLLREAPRDRAKYEGVGGAVLLTASMAGLASAIAVRIAFDLNMLVATFFGVLWGTAMLSLDRWLVAANQRQDRWIWTLMLALPRVLLALIVGIVMSTPLVLQIFDGEIEAQLEKTQQSEKSQLENRLDTDVRFRTLDSERQANDEARQQVKAGVTAADIANDPDVARLRKEVAELREQLRQAEQRLICERDGGCGTEKIGRGPAYEENLSVKTRVSADLRLRLAELDAAESLAARTQQAGLGERRSQVEETRRDLDRREAEREQQRALETARIDSNDGLLARIEALHDVGQERQDLQTAHLVLALFLIAIECLPVIVKLLLSFAKPTLYELKAAALDEEELRQAALARDTAYELQLVTAARDLQLREDRARTELHVERQRLRDLATAEATISARQQELRVRRNLEAASATATVDLAQPMSDQEYALQREVEAALKLPAPSQRPG